MAIFLLFQAVLKQHFEGCQGGKLRVLDIELFGTGETCSAIVTFDDTGDTRMRLISNSLSDFVNYCKMYITQEFNPFLNLRRNLLSLLAKSYNFPLW